MYYKRDYSVKDSKFSKASFLLNPHRKIVLWLIEYFYLVSKRCSSHFFRFLGKSSTNKREFARKVENINAKDRLFDKNNIFYEIQIKNETRPSLIIKENDWTNFSLKKNKSGYISFGVAPLINDYLSSNFSDWDISLKLIDKKNKTTEKTFSVPYNGYGGISAYYHNDGWIDLYYDLDKNEEFVSGSIKVSLNSKKNSLSNQNHHQDFLKVKIILKILLF